MKKTLITLAALAASVASAATYTYTTADFTGSGSGTEGVAFKSLELEEALTFDTSWKLDITITIGTENVNTWGSTMVATGLDASAVSYDGGFQLWRAAAGNYLSKVGDNGEDKASQNLTAGETYTFTVQYTATDDNLTLTGPGLTVTQTFADTTADITHLSSAALGHTGWDISITQTVADTPSGNVPEPATATLSLLALAGLAARRRRK